MFYFNMTGSVGIASVSQTMSVPASCHAVMPGASNEWN